jgi:hypothetical protein
MERRCIRPFTWTAADRTQTLGEPVRSGHSESYHRRMSLARVWRRQLYGASGAALIVPSTMLAALVLPALSGGFSQVGVLVQICPGPPALGAGAASRAVPSPRVAPAVVFVSATAEPGAEADAGRPSGHGGHAGD